MKKILAISASSSSKSINKELLKYTVTYFDTYAVEVIDLIKNVPIYSQDIEENDGFPEQLITLSNDMKNYDAFILALPEHNGSMTALLKNNLDWLSRIDRNIFNDKQVMLLSTSPGPKGGQYVTTHTSNVIPFLGAKVASTYSLGSFYDTFSKDGLAKEEEEKLAKAVEQLKAQL
jgi:chromate reductase, NAD(P)H dehydrogenase (quinone)